MTKTAREGFSERFQQALQEAGLSGSTQRELGKLFLVTPQAVRKWLGGESMPTSQRAPLVANLLGVRKAWLIDNELPMRSQTVSMAESGKPYDLADGQLSISGDEYRLLTRFRQLSQPVKASVVSLLDALGEQGKL